MFMNTLGAKLEKQHKQDLKFYQECVAKAAHDQEFDSDKWADVAGRLNKSYPDFTADVELEHKRMAVEAKQAELVALAEQREKEAKKGDKMYDDLEKLKRTTKEEIEAAENRMVQVQLDVRALQTKMDSTKMQIAAMQASLNK